jgi:thioredoxin reductase (NADPH)
MRSASSASARARALAGRRFQPARATALEERNGHHLVRVDDGTTVSARTVVIATGARYRRPALPRLEAAETRPARRPSSSAGEWRR